MTGQKKGGPDLFCVGAGKEGIACWPKQRAYGRDYFNR